MWRKIAGAAMAATVAFGVAGAGTAQAEPYWQCVTFARMFSGIQIFGDAWTWWNQATGKYTTGFTPEAGAVLVFQPYGKMTRGHVAVVSQVLTDRIVQVTHANWGGSRGKVEENVTIVDVSEKGDWSKVKVWYDPTGNLGSTVYPTYGFIYKSARDATAQMIAQVAGKPSRDGADDARILKVADKAARPAEAKATRLADKDADAAKVADLTIDKDAKAAKSPDKDAKATKVADKGARSDKDAKAAKGSDKDAKGAKVAAKGAKSDKDAKAAKGSDKDAKATKVADKGAKSDKDAKAAKGSDKDAKSTKVADKGAKSDKDAKAAKGSDKDSKATKVADKGAKSDKDAKAAKGSDKDAKATKVSDKGAKTETKSAKGKTAAKG